LNWTTRASHCPSYFGIQLKRPRRLSDRFCTCIIRKADVYYPLRLFRATCRALKITMTVEIACRFAAIRKVTSPE
ncbi:MAG TPA: hypothetical protein PL100_04230, partial [Bacillota bacterium]|nr:hypothetical protein [Bacillota bacterium]HQC48718.1 hypothetical protein [Bacillota bacterium]